MEKYYKAIREGLAQTDQISMFAVNPDEDLVKACIDFIREKGYSVTKPIETTVSAIRTLDDLIAYFYGRLKNERRDEYKAVYINSSRDRKIAKGFVENRMKINGLNRSTALQECAEIVKIVLDNYDLFHFKYQINFSIFGNDKLGWVTERAIDIINKKNKDKKDQEYQRRLDEITAEAAKETPRGYDDLDGLLAQLEEENDGKKESNS